MSPLMAYKLAFHYSPALEIVPHILQVNSCDFLYNYFIYNMIIKKSR